MLKKTLAALTMAGAVALVVPIAPASAQSVCSTLYLYVNGELVNQRVCVPPEG